jgi:thiamine biosynthesis lipoprotein
MPRRCRQPQSHLTLLCLIAAAWLLSSCNDQPSVSILQGRTMGTTYEVRLVDSEPDRGALRRSIEEELASLDRQLSTWRDDSDIARFNQLDTLEWFSLPPALGDVLERALELSRETDGALDPTLRPLSLAWGFQGDRTPSAPNDMEIEALLARTGADLIELERTLDGRRARKKNPHVEIDLSALAKGYAVDRLAMQVQRAGGRNYIVEIGGEVRAAGKRPDGSAWRVGLEQPDGVAREFVLLENEAIATSGDYRNYFEAAGVRYSHVLDPGTGRPVRHATAVATVIAADTMSADGLATAFLVLPAEQALAVADKLEVGLTLWLRTDDEFVAHSNPTFDLRRR